MQEVSRGDRVQVLFATRIADGGYLESEDDRSRPRWIQAGLEDPQAPLLNEVVLGMRVGDVKTFAMPPERSFGHVSDDRVVRIPVGSAPPGLAVGGRFAIMKKGVETFGIIRKITEKHVYLDTNHPLAGQTVHVEVELLAINKAPTRP